MKKPILKGSLLLFTAGVLLHLNTFGQIGKLNSTAYAGMGVDFKCTAGLVQPDSSVIITGKFNYVNQTIISGIAKLHPDGSVDPSFDPGSGADDYVNAVVRQPDGKLVIGGTFTKFDGVTTGGIARLNPDGSLDASFSAGSGFGGDVFAICLQADGKILVGGSFTTYNGAPAKRLIRLNSDGTKDNSFVTGTGCDNTVFDVSEQPDGKILVSGDFNNYNGSSIAKIVRLNANGDRDNTFNPDSIGANGMITSTATTADNKIIVGGFFTSYSGHPSGGIVRLNADGSEDITFQSGAGFNNYLNRVLLQPDGKILAIGNFTNYNGTAAVRVARLHADGTIDASFQTASGANDRCNALFLDADHRVYIGGFFTRYGANVRLRVARLLPDGTLDTGFFGDSKLNNVVLASAFQSNGKVILAGQFTSFNGTVANRIVRVDANGNLDPTFSSGTGANNNIRKMVVLANDKILIAGDFTTYNGVAANRIILLNSNGSVDNSFDAGTGADNIIYALAADHNGKIYIGGSFTKVNNMTKNRIARLNSDGSLDNTFSTGAGCNNIVYSITLQSDGKAIVGGQFTQYAGQAALRMVRLNTDGTRDSGFSITVNDLVNPVAIQSDGKIILGGSFTKVNNITKSRIARINVDGSLDSTFTGSITNGAVTGLCMVNDWIMAAGSFTTVNGSTHNRIALLNPDGTTNTAHNSLLNGASGTVNSIAFDRIERRLLIGGSFETVQSKLSLYLASLEGTNIRLAAVNDFPCPGLGIPLSYERKVDFDNGNTFTVQLSDANGKFNAPINLGSAATLTAGSDVITATLPQGIQPGTNYRIRIISSNPVDTSSISNTFTIHVPAAPTITYNGATTFCADENLSLTASSGVTYEWSNGATSPTIQATTSNSYRVSVTDNNHCTMVSAPVVVNVRPLPDTRIQVSAASLCNGGSVKLEGTAGNTYLWNNGATNSSIVVGQTGNYALTVTNVYGCKADSAVYVDLTAFYSSLIEAEGATTFCPGGKVTLKATLPNFTYRWNNAAKTQGIVVTTSDVYTVTISDGVCSMTDYIPVTVYPKPNTYLSPYNTASFCPGGDVTISAASGLEYQWNTGATTQSLTVNTPGSYSVIMTDANTGCVFKSDTVQVVAQNCLGINDIAESTLKVYPNPARDQIHIESNQLLGDVISVFDMMGNLVLRTENVALSNVVTLSVSSLAKGSYVVEANGKRLRFVKSE